jgi:hypothetical protein
MILNRHHAEPSDDQSQIPANIPSYRSNALADRARLGRTNAVGGIQGWGPKLF